MKHNVARLPLPIAEPVRWSTWALLAGLLLLVIASFATLPLKWGEFFSADAVRTSADFLHGFAPPELAPNFLMKVGVATFETLAMSAIGTVIAAVLCVWACRLAWRGRRT